MEEIPVRKGIFGISPESGKPYLKGCKCGRCGLHLFPAKRVCPVCLEETMIEVHLTGPGKIYSFTIVRQAATGFSVPYATVYVDLPEGVRVFAQSDLSCWENGIPVIGKEVKLVLGPIRQDERGNQVIGIKFNSL